MIQIKNLTKKYVTSDQNDKSGIFDIDLSLTKNGLYTILGKSGSGKTTLLNVIGLLDDYDSGEYFLDGNDVKTLDSKAIDSIRNSYIGYIFQDFKLFDELTVVENIKVNGFEDDEIILDLLTKFGLCEYKDKKVKFLSGGQKQRVAIIRSIIKKPKILLCDEPTGNLDKKNAQAIMKILKEYSQNAIVVLVTHDEELARDYSEESFRICDGLLESTNPCEDNIIQSKIDTVGLKLNKQGFKLMKASKKSNALLVSLQSITLSLVALIIGFSTLNINSVLYDCAKKNEEKAIRINDNYFDCEKYELQNFLDDDNIYSYYQTNIQYVDKSLDSARSYLYVTNVIPEELVINSGTVPCNNNEIVISDYCYEIMNHPEKLSFSLQMDITNQLTDFNVVGTYKTIYSNESYVSKSKNEKYYLSLYEFNKIYINNSDIFNSGNNYLLNSDFVLHGTLNKKEISAGIFNATACDENISLVEGRFPNSNDEVVISESCASSYHISLNNNYEIAFDDSNYYSSESFNPLSILGNLKVVGIYSTSYTYYDSKSFENALIVSQSAYENCSKIYDDCYKFQIYYFDLDYNLIKKVNDNGYKINSFSANEVYSIFHTIESIRIYISIVAVVIIIIYILFLIKDFGSTFKNKRESIGTLLCLGWSKKNVSVLISLNYLITISISLIVSIIISLIATISMNISISNISPTVISFLRFPYLGLLVGMIVEILVLLILNFASLRKISSRNLIWWIKNS